MESGAKELILFHHDPAHDDACIDTVVKEARNYYPGCGPRPRAGDCAVTRIRSLGRATAAWPRRELDG